LDGAYRIWPRKSWRFRLAKVKIRFGEPIDVPSVFSGELKELAYEKVTAALKQRIQQMLDEMRSKSDTFSGTLVLCVSVVKHVEKTPEAEHRVREKSLLRIELVQVFSSQCGPFQRT
jgi:hypothetical protein